jgi:hypothetical protein
MWKYEYRQGGRYYKFFRLILGYTTFVNYMQTCFDLHYIGKFDKGDIDMMTIYERDIYFIMLNKQIEEEIKNAEKQKQK